MVCFCQIQRLKVFFKDDDGVPNEQVGEMSGKSVVHTTSDQLHLNIFIDDQIWV